MKKVLLGDGFLLLNDREYEMLCQLPSFSERPVEDLPDLKPAPLPERKPNRRERRHPTSPRA